MKRGFIRVVYGIYDNSNRLTARRQKIDGDIKRILSNKFNETFQVFIFGSDNYERMVSQGFDCVKVDDNPAPFNLIKHQYRNKMELIRYAMESYDEMVYMDWDCVPQKKLPNNFWEECYKKDVIQACLQQYHRKKCMWRPVDQRKVANGGFLYIRDKSLPSRAIKYWETIPQENDEPAIAKLTDELMGNWTNTEKNMKVFWDRFETNFCQLHRASPYPAELLKTKDVCFIHYQG